MDSLLLTVAECAALLHVSADTVRRSIRAGIIPCKRLRANIRISRGWIDTYVVETAPVLLSRRQVAAKLGVSKYVVDGLRRRGMLPTVTIGGTTMVPASAVNEYVKRNAFAFLRTNAKSASVPRPASATNLVAHPAPAPSNGSRPAVPVRRTVFSNVRGV